MSDPAIEAAHRAQGAPLSTGVAAAREALQPIRVLHRRMDSGSCWSCVDINGGNQHWPCDTAKLIYSTEELSAWTGRNNELKGTAG